MSRHTIEKNRRKYNQWVATESLEDYALRYSPSSFRKWSPFLIANTAIGSISFLALEAIGAALLLDFGFTNAFWGIAFASIIIFLCSAPITYYCAKYNIDIDLLTRSAGFGYVGSTITSLIYASFCFIFFALEAAIMAQAFNLYFKLPLYIGYIICSIIIIPIVFYGITLINLLHKWTQPIWLILMIMPFYFVLKHEPQALSFMTQFTGNISGSNQFDPYYFGITTGISLALIPQIGEQVDYLRFMPDKNKSNRFSWWFAIFTAGPGWIILGFLKQIGGLLLASLAVLSGLAFIEAKEPIHMYTIAYSYLFDNKEIALFVTMIFVVISQIKINVTNAYAGSLAWSNFFSRITHSHPGRVVWVVFNIAIALMLMEMGVFQALAKILGLYSNVAIAWIGAVVSDLVINKPLKLSPPMVEFKRAHLYNINPVGYLSMIIASLLSIASFTGIFGLYAQAYSSLIALLVSLILPPIIAKITAGKYYIARENIHYKSSDKLETCGICQQQYAQTDFAFCTFYESPICSLCCTLDSNCHDYCKPKKTPFYQKIIVQLLSFLFQNNVSKNTSKRIANFSLIWGGMLILIGITLWLTFSSQIKEVNNAVFQLISTSFFQIYFSLGLLTSIASWWIVLIHESRELAETELTEQNKTLANEVAERRQAEKDLELSAKVFAQSQEGIMICDSRNQIISVNSAFTKITGYLTEEIIGNTPKILSSGIQNSNFYQAMWQEIQTNDYWQGEVWNRRKNGEVYPEWMTISVVRDNQQLVINYIAIFSDISQHKESEAQIEHMAHYDPLTDLPNRILLKTHVSHELDIANRNQSQFALLFLDLDHFKNINDSLGHSVGDQLLIEIAQRLKSVVRDEDTVSRLGGDEFNILILDTNFQGAALVAEKIVQVLSTTIHIEHNHLHISASIGISLFPDNGLDYETLYKNADTALYQAKDNGRNQYQFFTQEMQILTMRRMAIENHLRHAIEKNELTVFYQPQIDVKTRNIIGAEALLRWFHPEWGMVSPAEFIPIAEDTGLIIPIGDWVLEQAITQTKKWHTAGHTPITIAVNLSLAQFNEKLLFKKVKATLEKAQLPPHYLELELTESIAMKSADAAIKITQQLAEFGILLSIDDFGTGYSSLSYLQRFALHKLKIDQSFSFKMIENKETENIVNAIISLAKSLDLKTVAEGVETIEQLNMLTEKGCDEIQGYYFSKPVPADEFTKLLIDGFNLKKPKLN